MIFQKEGSNIPKEGKKKKKKKRIKEIDFMFCKMRSH